MSAPGEEAYLETLRRMVVELGPQRSLQASLRCILHTLAGRPPFLRPHLVMFEPHSRTLRLWMADASPMAADVVYEPGVGVTGQVFTLGRPVIVERLCDSSVFQNKFFSRTPQEMRELAFLSVPVFGHTQVTNEVPEVLGVLSADTPVAPRPVLEEQCRFLRVVAGLVGFQASQQLIAAQQWHYGMLPPETDLSGVREERVVIAVSRAMRKLLDQLEQAGSSTDPVLLRGEPGTGKELLAEVLHRGSIRGSMSLLRLDCAALPPEALEEELFGVQKWATPQVAQTRKGVIERAHMGSLYLGGVETLPQSLQLRLVQVMQTRELCRKGGGQAVHADVRFILGERTGERMGERIGGETTALSNVSWVMHLPPLRERPADIIPLAEEFLRRANKQRPHPVRRISMAAVNLLMQHPWPGNATELKHCIDRACGMCEEDVFAGHLPPTLQRDERGMELNFSEMVARFERELLDEALKRAHGNVLEASRQLQASYRVINYKVKKYGLRPRQYARQE